MPVDPEQRQEQERMRIFLELGWNFGTSLGKMRLQSRIVVLGSDSDQNLLDRNP